MLHRISHFAAVVVGTVATMASAASMACTIAPVDSNRIKQMMANEIAYRMGMSAQQIPLGAITQPQLHTPLGLGADCSGLSAYHYSAGFRIGAALQPGTGTWPPTTQPWPPTTQPPTTKPWPPTTKPPTTKPWPPHKPWPHRQGQCFYEGVAVVLGYGYTSPVAVNFEQKCS